MVEAVSFQAWVLKRSRVARVFQKRFVSIRGSIIYSFRTADLSKGDPLPEAASLHWDVEGCIVASTPARGKHAWSVYGGPKISEIIVFTTSSAAAANDCMRAMLRATLRDSTLPKIQIELKVIRAPCDFIVAEVQHNYLAIAKNGQVELNLWDYRPGEKIIFSGGGSEASLALCNVKPGDAQEVKLSLNGAALVLNLKTSETFWDLFSPVTCIHPLLHFDWDFFKVQIKRFVRLIEKWQELRASVCDILEWRWPLYSAAWLSYISCTFLLLPSFAPAIHLAHFSVHIFFSNRSVSTTPAAPPRLASPEIWENQRRLLGGGIFHSSNLLVLDRPKFSDDAGVVVFTAPAAGTYRPIVNDDTDENGWQYSWRWKGGWHKECGAFDFVRRRRWRERPEGGRSPGAGGAEEDEENQPKQAGFTGIFSEFKNVAGKAQLEIEEICQLIETYLALFSWGNENITGLVMVPLFILVLLAFAVSLPTLIYAYIFSLFFSGYRKGKWKRLLRRCAERHVRAAAETWTGDAPKLAAAITKRTGAEISVKILEGVAGDLEGLAEVVRLQVLPQQPKWLRRDFIDNFMNHASSLTSRPEEIIEVDELPVADDGNSEEEQN